MKLIDSKQKVFALIYGASGSGKTHLAATYGLWYPEEPVLLIDADQGSDTLNAKEFKSLKNIFVISFDLFEDLDHCYTLCRDNTVEGWIKAIPQLEGLLTKPFRCVIWDTWTAIQWDLLTELRRKNKLLGSGLRYRDNIQLQHWGQMTDLNKLAVESFKAIEMDCLFLMQEAIKEDDVSKSLVKGPAIHGKLSLELPAYFSAVIHTYNTPTGAWKATTAPKMGWPAKVRGIQGKDIENPTLKELLI